MKNSAYKFSKKHLLYLAGILILAIVIYSNSIKNEYVLGWDDVEQVVENKDIRSLSWDNVQTFFSKFYVGMYQPITTLSYAIEYNFSELNPATNHITNLLLHLINIVLVFLLFYYFTKRIEISLIVSLFFAVHPMNVESVSWISTRSNLLYSLFYLASLLTYLKFLQNKKSINLIFTFLFFILSLLSKASAITLPVILLLFDFFYHRKFNYKSLLEKVPFFILSIIFGMVAFQGRTEFGHIGSLKESFSLLDRIVFIGYSFVLYIVKLFVPLNLSAIHYYPVISTPNVESAVGWEYYLAAFICLVIAVYTIILFIQALIKNKYNNIIFFGIVFFVTTASVIIHIIPIGLQIIAERYMYIPYLGLFFIIAHYYVVVKDTKKLSKFKNYFLGIILIFAIGFCILTYQRNKVWKNNYTLLTDVINKNPRIWHGYLVRGDGFSHKGEYLRALEDYDQAIYRNRRYNRSYVNRAAAFAKVNKFQEAIFDLNKAIILNNQQPEAYYNRGLAKFNLKDYKIAILDFDTAIQQDPEYILAYHYRGTSYGLLEKFDKAIIDFNTAIGLEPENSLFYFSRGVAKFKKRNFQEAILDFNIAIDLSPNYSEAFVTRGVAWLMLKNLNASCADFRQAQSLGNKEGNKLVMKYCEMGLNSNEMPDE